MTLNTWNAPNVGIDGRNKYLDILEAAWQDHLKPREPDAPTVISLFAGCGGSSLGYSMAGYRELLAVEWNKNAIETFRLNFPDVPVYHGDICNLTIEQCLEMTGLKEGELDVLDGSPPCQGFSISGNWNINDDRNQLFREYVRLLRGLKPKIFIMENVFGMVVGKMKLIFAEIMRELKASGYKVSARLLNAMYFNVPQSRQRMIFIGVKEDLGIELSHPKAEYRPITISEAWNNIKDNDIPPPLTKSLINIVPLMRQGQCQDDITHKGGYQTVRVYFNKPSPAVTKLVAGIGFGALIHPTEDRVFSISEMKRISSFPDEFQFIGNYKQKKAQMGNCVPPLFMRSIAKHIRENLLTE